MDLRFLDTFHFEDNIPSFFFNLISKLINSPVLDSNRLEIPKHFTASLSSNDWQMDLSYGLYSFGRKPQDTSPPPDVAFPVEDSRVSRRTGWFVYLPIEGLALFIKHKNNNNTAYVNDHPCNFSLLQNNAKIHIPKDKSHEIIFESEHSTCLQYEDISYVFAHKKQPEHIFSIPEEQQHFLLYYIIGSMGEGETGKTYIAFDTSSDRLVTIKKFKLDMKKTPNKDSFLKDFFQDYRLFQIERQSFLDPHSQNFLSGPPKNLEEASSIAHINFSQVINAHFLFHDQKEFFCRVNEYTPSISLQKYLDALSESNKKLPLIHFKNIIYQVIVAIHFLQSRNIICANLNPKKILLIPYSFGVLIKLCDYPLNEKANPIEIDAHNSKLESKNFHFTAPEAAELENLRPSMDIFSIGSICYYLLADEVLFSEITDFEKWKSSYQTFTMKQRCVDKIKEKVSSNFASLILQCLHHNETERPSLSDLYEAVLQ